MFKRLLSIIIVTSVLFLPLQAIAQTDTSTTTSRDERLSKAVTDQNVVLDVPTQTILVLRCQNAQLVLKNIQDETDKLVRLRIDTYGYIQNELQAIKLRMFRQGADASETDLLTGKIQQALDRFTVQADNYGTALDDVVNVDCQQKPEQFQAGLIVMRLQRSKLLDDANNLKTIITSSDDNIFTQLKKRLTI